MRNAIITGASGFVGSTLANHLLDEGYNVIALGRREFKDIKFSRLKKHDNLKYLKLDMANIAELPRHINKLSNFNYEKSIFFHFAWSGKNGLSDLCVKSQIKNVQWTVDSLRVAESIGCSKYIFVGTMEEIIVKKYLSLNHKSDDFYNRHVIYALAKIAARNSLKLSFNPSRISLIFATKSHVMGPNDDRDSFLQVALKKLCLNHELTLNSGQNYFDVVSSSDCAKAFQLIGEKGISTSEYWIGSGNPRKLKDYVTSLANICNPSYELKFGKLSFNDVTLSPKDFSIDLLKKDTGFIPKLSFEEIIPDIYQSIFGKQL